VRYKIRKLQPADAEDFRRVRLDALRLHPEAFGSAYEDEVAFDQAQIAQRWSTPGFMRFGAFDGNGELVGIVGLQIRLGVKEEHKAHLFSMYVDAANRGTAVAEQLVAAVIAGARAAGALVLHLSVTVGNAPAQRLYRRMGFTVYGIERRALRIDDRFYDEELMALQLD
jgi:RimJ/RimL family protein N-acetyltransferase